MAAPVVAGLKAAELIALGGTIASTATAIGTLPDEFVTIGNISISFASGGEMYVGDSFVITGEFDVSYGEVSGSEGVIEIEIIEEGRGVIKTFPQIQATSPKEHISFRMNGRTISHGTKYYYIKVTATGEEDLSWAPTGDTVITKTGVSGTIGLEVKKPISFSTNLLTPTINHGDFARAIMTATNHSESDGRIVVEIGGQRSFPREPHALTTRIDAGQSDLQVLDYRKRHHGDNHTDEKTIYIEPIKHIYHNHQIKAPWGNSYYRYDQILPDSEKVFLPIPVICKGTKTEKEVSYIPRRTSNSVQSAEYNYRCRVQDENEETLLCGAILFDQYGNSLNGHLNSQEGRIHFQGKLCGQVAILRITPTSTLYSAYQTHFYLNKNEIDDAPESFVFFPARLPSIQGVVFIEELNRVVSGAEISLIQGDNKVISKSITQEDGKFELSSDTKVFGDGSAMIKASLPWNLSYDWMETELYLEVSLEQVQDPESTFVFNAKVKQVVDWADISGKIVFKDYLSGAYKPVAGAEVVVRNEKDEIEDKSMSDDHGSYSFGVKPGGYFVEVVNAEELGFENSSKDFLEVRTSRDQVDVKLSLPKPIFERKTTRYFKGKSVSIKEDKIAIFENGKLKNEVDLDTENFYVDVQELNSESKLSIALKRGKDLGKPIDISNFFRNS